MTEARCPLCQPGRGLAPVDPAIRPPLLQCGGCAGVWARSAAVQDARRRYGRRHTLMLQQLRPHACRRCGKRMQTSWERCRACSAPQAIPCLDCGKPMARVRVQTCVVDLCRPCRASWLDAGELALLARWSEAGAAPSRVASAGAPAGGSLTPVDALIDPGGELVVRASVEAVSHLPDVAHAAAEGAVGLVEGAGEVAVKVVAGAAEVTVEVVGGLLAGLFDGL